MLCVGRERNALYYRFFSRFLLVYCDLPTHTRFPFRRELKQLMIWHIDVARTVNSAAYYSNWGNSTNYRWMIFVFNNCLFFFCFLSGFSWSSRNTRNCHGHICYHVRGQKMDPIFHDVLCWHCMPVHHIPRWTSKQRVAENHLFDVGWAIIILFESFCYEYFIKSFRITFFLN